jgi:hypothetical protein
MKAEAMVTVVTARRWWWWRQVQWRRCVPALHDDAEVVALASEALVRLFLHLERDVGVVVVDLGPRLPPWHDVQREAPPVDLLLL